MRTLALFIAGILIGFLLNTQPPTQYTELDGKQWCYIDTYYNLDDVHQDTSYLVNVNGSKYEVYVKCVVE